MLARSPFLLAARGESGPHTPVWFMRQAGRSLPEYRAVREGTTMLESCMRPDLVVEITLQPVRRYGVDAATLLRHRWYAAEVDRLRGGDQARCRAGGGGPDPRPRRAGRGAPVTPADVPYITESVQQLVGGAGETPLIGFAGAPFTVASSTWSRAGRARTTPRPRR